MMWVPHIKKIIYDLLTLSLNHKRFFNMWGPHHLWFRMGSFVSLKNKSSHDVFWCAGLIFCYLHSIFVVKVWIIYLLSSQHFRCEGFIFLPRKCFLGMDIFTFTVFCSEDSCVKIWSHAVSRKQFGLTWT